LSGLNQEPVVMLLSRDMGDIVLRRRVLTGTEHPP
jgi:hypothetical protein